MASSATWVRQYTSFTATGTDLSILFKSTGTYYFYNMQLETGKICSDWTPNPADVDDDLENATSIAQQAADKFSWIVKSGTSSSNFEITDKFMNLVSTNINLDGIVSFMNTAKGDGRKNLYNLDYSSFENVASQEDAICYAKDNGVTSVAIDSSVSYDGDKSLKISYTTANLNSNTTPLYLGSSANNYGCVKIQAGKQYILSCYVKSDSTTGLFMIDIQGHNTPDTKTGGLYISNMDPRRLPGSSTGVSLSTDWQRAVCAIEVANNATELYWSVVPLIWGRPSSSNVPQTFNVWVDCIMLEEVDSISNEPGTYILDKETIIDGGSVKTNSITSNQILANSITADKIATDAIKSRNYISSSGTQGSFLNLSDGSFTSPNLSWDSNGNLIAKNANLSGEITATKGTIGGWSIISNSFFTKYNSSIDSYGTGISGDNNRYVLWAGEKNNAYGVNRNSDTPTDATLRIWRNGAIEIQGNDSTTSGIGHLYKILIQAGRIKVGIDDHYIGSICGSDTTLDNQVINQHVSLTAHKGYGWSILHTNDSGNLICDIKRDPNTNGIKFFDDLLISSGGNQIQLNANNQGSIELYGNTPFIDFHCGYSDADYTSRIIANGSNSLNITGNLWVDTDIHAGSWLYASEVHSGGAVVISSDSESFYWAHGFQIARGTSWGGVCIGDDSQGLRLYGTSIWASHSISTSDENLKENFTTLDQYEDFYMNLNPIGFNYIGDYDGKKTHFGFGAHKTEDILESEGYDSDKFAVVTHRPLVQEDIEKRFGKDVEVDIETEYGISYTEFIALNTHMIQKTRRELEQVKQEKTDLEARLQAIEANLGL